MEKYLLNFFLSFRNFQKMLYTLKKIWPSEVNCFGNYRQEQAGLVKCLKSPVWEDLWALNMLRGPNDCLNQHGGLFVVFFDPYERKWAEKKYRLSSIWNLKTICQLIVTRWQVLSLSKSRRLKQSIQMQLSRNRKIFSGFFSAFMKYA